MFNSYILNSLLKECNAMNNIKICSHPECNKPRANAGIQPNGNPIYRKKCLEHYKQELAEKRGFNNHLEYEKSTRLELAKSLGFDSYADYKNSTHPWRYARKDYCENIDSRLGYKCTTTIVVKAQLEVDHIDGDPTNNEESNLQTLCGCCHTYKTLISEDYKSPGRKALGIQTK